MEPNEKLNELIINLKPIFSVFILIELKKFFLIQAFAAIFTH